MHLPFNPANPLESVPKVQWQNMEKPKQSLSTAALFDSKKPTNQTKQTKNPLETGPH